MPLNLLDPQHLTISRFGKWVLSLQACLPKLFSCPKCGDTNRTKFGTAR